MPENLNPEKVAPQLSTEERKANVIKYLGYKRFHSIHTAVRAAGVPLATHYMWLKQDDDYYEKCRAQCDKQAERELKLAEAAAEGAKKVDFHIWKAKLWNRDFTDAAIERQVAADFEDTTKGDTRTILESGQ